MKWIACSRSIATMTTASIVIAGAAAAGSADRAGHGATAATPHVAAPHIAAPHIAHESTRHAGAQQRLATRAKADRYYQVSRLIGSYVLDLEGQRIGKVDNLIIDDAGRIIQVLIALKEALDMDGTPVPVAPHRAEIVSVDGARVTVIRVDLTREELVQAQLTHLKSSARAPAEREAGRPDTQRLAEPLF